MAWKSFYLAAGIVSTAALPFLEYPSGTANIPDGPCIVAANHSSFLDGPLLSLAYCKARLRPLHMIAYEEPFRHWLMGWILRSGGAIPFRRGDRASQGNMLAAALAWLAAGEAVGIFPEGHINRKPLLNRARPGAALLALESGAPVVPAAIIGSDAILPPGKPIPRPAARARIVFGQPVALLEKEQAYARLPGVERRVLVKNLGYRILRAIGALSGRECVE
jgi:1-acyl-sn-glycerol-3-phosphate acyltransferase